MQKNDNCGLALPCERGLVTGTMHSPGQTEKIDTLFQFTFQEKYVHMFWLKCKGLIANA